MIKTAFNDSLSGRFFHPEIEPKRSIPSVLPLQINFIAIYKLLWIIVLFTSPVNIRPQGVRTCGQRGDGVGDVAP